MSKREIERKLAGNQFWFWGQVARHCERFAYQPGLSYNQAMGHMMGALEAQANAIGWASR